MKISVIGAGNMGGALIKGWYRNYKDADITVVARRQETIDKVKSECPEVNAVINNREATADADVIVIAVKPWQVNGVIDAIKHNFRKETILISVAAGITLEKLKEMTTECERPQLFYAIPNIAAEFGASMTFVCTPPETEAGAVGKVRSLLDAVGRTIFCDEKQTKAGMLMASCGLAYVMRILRAQSEAGVEMGFKPDEALKIAMQTMTGAVSLLENTHEHPEQAIDRVATPGGYTIKGLNEMEHSGLVSGIIRVFETGM